jgi:serine/threonine-protein kinase
MNEAPAVACGLRRKLLDFEARVIGEVIDGKYQITRLLGQGGMGAVYHAQHRGTGRRVAVKVITGNLANNPVLVARFEREARAAGVIETQHIVQVLDSGADAARGLPYLVMEFLVGEDLQQLIRRIGPLPPEVAVRIVAQACLGLQRAHEAGVVHRDIKPANLFLAKREEGEILVKLLDFGIAKVMMEELGPSEGGGLTRTGSMLGSPLYMSPEQAKGLKDIDHRTDLWSLGAVLYEALCGRSPHGHITTLGQIILAICNHPPTPIQDMAPWVPAGVAAVVNGALQIDRAARFQSAAAMLNALRASIPLGSTVHESMLTPLPEAERARVAPRLAADALNAAQAMSSPNAVITGGGVTHPGPVAKGRSGNALAIGAAVLTLGGLTAGVAVVMTRPRGDLPGAALAPDSTVSPAQAAFTGLPVTAGSPAGVPGPTVVPAAATGEVAATDAGALAERPAVDAAPKPPARSAAPLAGVATPPAPRAKASAVPVTPPPVKPAGQGPDRGFDK